MEKVFQEAVRVLGEGDPCVIATVVRTKGSTPQKPGAKLLVRKDGSAVGTLGGGCVEGDIWFAAKMLLREGGSTQLRDYYLNEEIAARDGLVCGGTMYFLIDPVRSPGEFLPYAEEINRAYQGGSSVALVEVTRAPGASSLKVGDKALIRDDGSALGSLRDEALWRESQKTARELMEQGGVRYLSLDNGVEAIVEGFTSPATLLLVGGGHISKSVAPLAKSVGFRVWVVDDRPEFANTERFPQAERTLVAGYKEGIAQLPITPNTYIVIATRGHRYDDLALEAAACSSARYVGLVGSKRKVILIYKELLARGIPQERVEAIHSPIGLNIGAQSPEEIAISIMSEVLMAKLGGDGRPMKLDKGRIEAIRGMMRLYPSKV